MNLKSYENAYQIYKKLPLINAILIMVLTLVWAILDYDMCLTGISDLEFFGCLIIWLLIGAVIAGVTAFLTQISISATVLRTDAVLTIAENIKKAD